MRRSRKILVVSHCILNQNTVIEAEARAMGMIPSVTDWALDQGYGIVQLPCPEFTYLGLDRPPMTYQQYDTQEYRSHCRRILQPVVDQLLAYKNSGYELIGTVGIGSSPSCDPGKGVFMEEFQSLLAENDITLPNWWYLPDTSDPVFQPETHKRDSV
ncbi:CD3072 family TudS-related putative desulfidase [Brevibacillus sp. B_LB10_24]|uniref:CD3072 family TudS-related putative desulfidase n=1 Tax=Brevibacillus sp. B_LB10_24 TaxID=3380645 RepID=UPI0038BD3810